MKAIVFGINGQDGYYLRQLLEKNKCNVIGLGKQNSVSDTDITNYESVLQLVQDVRPDFIFHFAAKSSTGHEVMLENFETISVGTLNILEAVKNTASQTKVFVTGSGLQFRNTGQPISENDPFEARDAYSLCRIQSVYAARYYRSLGIKTYVGYFFNHDSPLRSEHHMTKKIAEAAKRIAAGSEEKLEIGDLNTVKEHGFAGDITKAVWMLMNQEKIFEAVIGTGKGYSIREWVEQCFSLKGLNWKDHVVQKEDYISTYQKLVSDPSVINSLGWKHETEFIELAQMMMQ